MALWSSSASGGRLLSSGLSRWTLSGGGKGDGWSHSIVDKCVDKSGRLMKARLWELQTEMHRRSGRSLVAREMQTLASDCTHNARASNGGSGAGGGVVPATKL